VGYRISPPSASPVIAKKMGATAAAATDADAEVEVMGCRSREERDAEGFRNAQVLQGGDDDGDDEERRPGGDGGAVDRW